jgi:proton-coupled amino acid transporter
MVLHERRGKTTNVELSLHPIETTRTGESMTGDTSFQGTMFEKPAESSSAEEREGFLDYNRKRDDGISEWEAAASLAKAIMGAGSFALPWAFSNMGFIAGPIFMTVLMIFSVNSLDMLVKCSRAVRCSTNDNHSYVDVSRAILGKFGAFLTYLANISASMGVCGSYLLFIAANLQSLLSSPNNDVTQGSFIILILPVAVLLSSVRDMKVFAFTSCLGDVSVILGMVVVLFYGLMYHGSNFGNDCVPIGSIETMPLAVGAIGYLFLIHFVALPIESSMANPDQFQAVAQKTFAACGLLSGVFGIIGYLLFGADTQQIVLLNVEGSYFVSAVKLLLCVDLLLTYPVVMRPSIVIVEQSMSSMLAAKKTKTNQHRPVGWSVHMATCSLLGLLAACASIYVPAFGLLSGLVGGVSQTFLALVLPPLMLAHKHHPSTKFITKMHKTEMILFVTGCTLIIWTAISTWNELH